MIKRATIEDRSFLDSVWNHPDIQPFILDDYARKESRSMDWNAFFSMPVVYFLIPISEQEKKMGCFFIYPWNSICFEVHSLILPEFRGNGLVGYVKEGIKWMVGNTNCRKLVTQVPTFNRRAYAFAVKSGFSIEGTNKSSFLRNGKLYDQYLFGLKLEG